VAPLLTTGSQMMCPHGGQVSAVSSNTKVKAGDPVLRVSDTFTISGCPFVVGTVAHPCVSVKWKQPASDASALGDSVLTSQSVGLCQAADMVGTDGAQGTVLVSMTQSKAKAS
jgi:hypothetical protein